MNQPPRTGPVFAFAHPAEGELLQRAGLATVELGVGKTAAVLSMARLLGGQRPSCVVLVGVAGAFPPRHTRVDRAPDLGELVLVTEALLADEGVQTEEGFLAADELGLSEVGPFRADGRRSEALRAAMGARAVRAATVSTCSGSEELSESRAVRTEAAIETMESAAVMATCASYSVPMVEVRAVSNWTGDRRRGEFRLAEACELVQRAVLAAASDGRLEEALR